MSEIPADLMHEARKVADQLWLATHEKADAAKLIARALLAEREACARVASSLDARGVAAAIRARAALQGGNDAR